MFQPLSTLSMTATAATAGDTAFFIDGDAAPRRRWRFLERILASSDGSEYCARDAFMGRVILIAIH